MQITHHEIIEHKACRIVGRSIRASALSPQIRELWTSCFEEGLFQKLMLPELVTDDMKPEAIGAMYDVDASGNFSYIVGTFLKADIVMEGYDLVDFPAGKAIVAWIKGPMNKVLASAPSLAETKLSDLGYEPDYSSIFGIEIYTDERFNSEMEKGKGNVVLDYLIPIR
jgi:predicted transcriptional regulator YdeE